VREIVRVTTAFRRRSVYVQGNAPANQQGCLVVVVVVVVELCFQRDPQGLAQFGRP
jgi:hypothetical protein